MKTKHSHSIQSPPVAQVANAIVDRPMKNYSVRLNYNVWTEIDAVVGKPDNVGGWVNASEFIRDAVLNQLNDIRAASALGTPKGLKRRGERSTK